MQHHGVLRFTAQVCTMYRTVPHEVAGCCHRLRMRGCLALHCAALHMPPPPAHEPRPPAHRLPLVHHSARYCPYCTGRRTVSDGVPHAAQVLVSTAVIAAAAAAFSAAGGPGALVLGGGLALSSTAVAMQVRLPTLEAFVT